MLLMWILLTICVSYLASKFNRDWVSYFVLALLLSPLIGFIVLLIKGKAKSGLQLRNEYKEYKMYSDAFISRYLESESVHQENPIIKEVFDSLSSNKTVDIGMIKSALNIIK